MFASECVCAGAAHVRTQLSALYYIMHVVFGFREGKSDHLASFPSSTSFDDRIPQSQTCFVLVFTLIK